MFNSFHTDGVKAFDENNYEQAKACFLKAIEKNPEVAESYFYLAKCYFFCDEPRQAIPPSLTFIELRKNNLDEVANVSYAFDLLGQCYEAEKQDTTALRCYEMATEIYPSGAAAWNNMGLFYIKSALHHLETDLTNSTKFFEGALFFIQTALKLCGHNPVFLQTLAGWYEQYIEVLERAVENEEATQKNIASNFSYAIQYYRKALTACHEHDLALRNIISSNLATCLAQYGHHLYKKKDYKNALEVYLEAMHLDPEDTVVINQIGMSLFKQDCFPEARRYFSSILKKTEDNQESADAWLNIACTYRLEKEWEKAEEALSNSRKFAPEDSSIIEEEKKLKESKPAKPAALLISNTPQTLFGNSNPEPPGAGSKTVQEPSSQFEIN